MSQFVEKCYRNNLVYTALKMVGSGGIKLSSSTVHSWWPQHLAVSRKLSLSSRKGLQPQRTSHSCPGDWVSLYKLSSLLHPKPAACNRTFFFASLSTISTKPAWSSLSLSTPFLTIHDHLRSAGHRRGHQIMKNCWLWKSMRTDLKRLDSQR